MDDKGTTSARHLAARQRKDTDLGFSRTERLESHRKRFGLMLLPLSCLMSYALGMGLLPLLDPDIGNIPWAQNYLLGGAVWAGATIAIWGVLSWLSIPVWKFLILAAGSFILITVRADSGSKAGWMLTPTGFAAAMSILGAGYLVWGYYIPLALGRRREHTSPDPSEKDVNDRIAEVAGSVPYQTLAESNTVRFVYERVAPQVNEKIIAFHNAGLRTSWVLTTQRLYYFHGDSPKKRGTINFDDVTQWLVTEGVIFVTIDFLMKNGTTIEVEDLLEAPPFNETSQGGACRGEHGGHLTKCRCPSCNAKLTGVTKEMAGDIGVCPKCQAEFTIELGK